MISSESPVLENSTPGLTSGGEETWLRQRLRHRHRAKAAGNSYSLVPTAGRASPRLYINWWTSLPRNPNERDVLAHAGDRSFNFKGVRVLPWFPGSLTAALRNPPNPRSVAFLHAILAREGAALQTGWNSSAATDAHHRTLMSSPMRCSGSVPSLSRRKAFNAKDRSDAPERRAGSRFQPMT